MAEVKFTQLPPANPFTGTEILAFAQTGVSVQATLNAIAEFVSDSGFNYGDGITFDDGTNTISADINTTNMQFTAAQINTIQDINASASPTFETMTLTSTTAGFLMPRMTTVQFDSIPTPDNGLIAWSQSSNRFRVNSGFPGSPDYKELAYFGDLPIDTTSYGEVFFQGNTVETVISAIGVFAKVDAVYNAGDLLNFTNGSGLLTYTGTDTKEFALNLSLTTTLNLSTSNISVVLYKNGSPISKSEQTSFTGSTTPGLQNGSVNALVSLSTGDYIEIYVANNDNTSNILVQDLNLNVCSVGGSVGNLQDQVVVAWDNSTDPVSVVAGTDIDITGGVISYTGGGSGGATGNFLLGTCLVPRTTFQFGTYLSLIDSLAGTQTIAPNSLAIGDSVKISATFQLFPTLTTNPTVSGSFQYVFGNTILNPPPTYNIILTNNASRAGWLEYTITRTSSTEVTIDATGGFTPTDTSKYNATVPDQSLFVSNTLPYDENQSYLMDVQWTRLNSGSQFLDVTAYNLVIEQKTPGTGGIDGIVQSWDGLTFPVNVTAGTNMSITNGTISTTGEPNVVTSVEGSTSPVGLTAGSGINITGGVISATGSASADNSSFFTTLLPTDNYVSGVYTPVWFTSTGNNQIDANTWAIGDTFEIEIVGECVTRGAVADTTTGSFFRLTVGANQILTNDLDVPLIIDGQVRVKPFNFKIMFTRIDDIASQPTWTVTGNGFFSDLSNNLQYIALQTSTLYNIDVTINNIINLEYIQNHTVGNTYDFQCVQLNMRKYTV
ncbi:MAG: hypothetical protein ACYSW3_27785 [Planctomycetota bacterium]|jgi:hypothetical protein